MRKIPPKEGIVEDEGGGGMYTMSKHKRRGLGGTTRGYPYFGIVHSVATRTMKKRNR